MQYKKDGLFNKCAETNRHPYAKKVYADLLSHTKFKRNIDLNVKHQTIKLTQKCNT